MSDVANSQEVAAYDANATVQGFADGSIAVYSSIKDDSFEGRLATVNAITTAVPLNLNLDHAFNLKNFVLQAITVTDDDGMGVPAVRSILIDSEGNSYASVSNGVISALQNLTGVLGQPETWPEAGVPVYVSEERTRRGYRVMTLKVGVPAKGK